MTVLWLVALAAGVALLWYAGWLATDVAAVEWPDETPLRTREERAQDQRLIQLARLLGANDLHEAHRVVASIAARLDSDQPLSPGVRRFLEAPPLADPDRYRRELSQVLTQLEAP